MQEIPPAAHPSARAHGQHGSIIIYLIVGLVAFGVLAMAGMTRFGATVQSVFAPNCATSARYMAESGMRYATARLRACANEAAVQTAVQDMTNNPTITVDSGKGLAFTLAVSYDTGTKLATVTSTGRSCSNQSQVSAPTPATTVNLPLIASSGPAPTPGTALSGSAFFSSLQVNPSDSSNPGVSVDATAQTVSLGNNQKESSGSVWYTGSNDVCSQGNCTLGSGLCAYWQFQFKNSSSGDGYVWTLMSGDTNTKYSNGGDKDLGEMLGYGGLGSSGLGIQAPKLGVEFDIYSNTGTGNSCLSGSRNDANAIDHVAFLYWGAETVAGCSATYDDNRHGAGAGNSTQPMNSKNTDGSGSGSDGYYYRSTTNDWMKNGGIFYYRYELDRATVPDAKGLYCYRARSWVKKSGDSGLTGMSNCTATYTGSTPEMTQFFTLDASMHNKLNKVFMGWTEGTGAATELVTLSNIFIDFKSAPAVPIVPSDYVGAWTFYELSNDTVNDRSANANTGTLKGNYSWGSPGRDCALPGLTGCPNSGYINFTNTGRVEVPDAANLRLTSAGTIACWIYIDSYVNAAGLVHKGQLGGAFADEAYSLQFYSSNRAVSLLVTDKDGHVLQVDSANLNRNQWYHIAATWDPSFAKMYVNGALVATTTNSIHLSARTNPTGALTIGAQLPQNGSGGYPFDGYMDEVYLYNRALTGAEIANMALGHP